MAEINVRYLIEAVARIQGLKQATAEMSKAEVTARNLARGMSKSSKLIGIQTSTAFSKTAGQFQKTTATFVDGGNKIQTTFKGMGASAVPLKQSVSSVNKAMGAGVGVAGQFQKALARVAIVVPIWFLFRQVISGVFNTLRNGVKDIIEFDRALQKAKRNLQGSSIVIEKNFKRLKGEVQALSKETGVSVQKITKAFQKFATTGLDFETSMAGATASVKTAILLFGETEEVANAVARAYRVLGGRTDEYTSKGEELKNFLSLVAELWKDNAFEVNEFAGAFERFAPTARASNVSLKETAVLLATLQTAGIRGTRAGRLLSTAVLQMEKNFDKFNSTLGINLANEESTFDRLRAITKAIEQMNKTNPVEASQAISQLFRIRGGQSIRALTALNSELEIAIQKTGDLTKTEKEFDEVNATIGQLAKRFTNANKEIGRALVTGIVGGDDFRDSLESVVEVLEQADKWAKIFGGSLRYAFASATADFSYFSDQFGKHVQHQLNSATVIASEQGEVFAVEYLKALKGELSKEELQNLLIGLTTFGAENINLDPGLVAQMEEVLKKKIAEAPIEAEADIIVKGETITFEEQTQLAKKLIDLQIDRVKNEGALASEALNLKNILLEQFNIDQEAIKVLERQLDIEQERTEEKRLQNTLSSDSVKLFRIAQEHGSGVAKRIGEVLSGDIDFDSFVRRGGEAVDIFKKDFANVFEQQQALRFFKGDTVPGAKGLRGGSSIPIQEEAIRKGLSGLPTTLQGSFDRLIKELADLKSDTPSIDEQNVEQLRAGTLIVGSFPGRASASLDRTVPGAINNAEASRLLNIANVASRVAPGTDQINNRNLGSLLDRFAREGFRNIPVPPIAPTIPTTAPQAGRGFTGNINFGDTIVNAEGLSEAEVLAIYDKSKAQERNELVRKLKTVGTAEREAVRDIVNRE